VARVTGQRGNLCRAEALTLAMQTKGTGRRVRRRDPLVDVVESPDGLLTVIVHTTSPAERADAELERAARRSPKRVTH
jgi:hypothetical protein